jgi:hypothetical protein
VQIDMRRQPDGSGISNSNVRQGWPTGEKPSGDSRSRDECCQTFEKSAIGNALQSESSERRMAPGKTCGRTTDSLGAVSAEEFRSADVSEDHSPDQSDRGRESRLVLRVERSVRKPTAPGLQTSDLVAQRITR